MGNREDGENKFDPDLSSIDNTYISIGPLVTILYSDWSTL